MDVEQIPCSVINMSFFDKLRNPDKGIISSSGVIRKRYDSEIHDFLVSDKLREVRRDVIRYLTNFISIFYLCP